MNQGVEMLLARMDSNPGEFSDPDISNKWSWVLVEIGNRGYALTHPGNGASPIIQTHPPYSHIPLPYLTDEEVLALYRKFSSIQGDRFTAEVTKTLLRDPVFNSVAATKQAQLGNSTWNPPFKIP